MSSAHYKKVGKDQIISKSDTGDEDIDVIGKGAFSKVFSGRFDDKDVAVKRVNKVDYKSMELRFPRYFRHENIVRYLYKDFDWKFMYIVMEKCDCNLQQFIGDVSFQNIGYISPIEILRQTNNGLAYLHDIKHTIHRNLIPSNTLLLLRGQEWVIRIADFGLSKRLPQTSNKGTVGYAAPEVLNKGKISKKSDIFSLGILYYFTLSGGEHPYGTDMLKLDAEICDGEQPTMGLLEKKYADDAKFLILSMIAYKCEDRFDITQVQSHHLFWNNEKKLNFIQEVSDYAIAKTTSKVISTKLNENSELVIGKSWRAPVYAKSPVIEKEIEEMRSKKQGDDIMSLLRNIRNLKKHFDEKSTEFKNLIAIGGSVNDIMEFFTKMFPALISHVYEVMRSEERGNPTFKSFFYAKEESIPVMQSPARQIYFKQEITLNRDEDETTSMSEIDEIQESLVDADACIQTGAENKDKDSFKETDVEFEQSCNSSETKETQEKGPFECEDKEILDETIETIVRNQTVWEANVIPKLSWIFTDLKNDIEEIEDIEDIETISEYMRKKDKKCKEFEIMYNKNIGPAGYENVGRMVKKHKVRILRLADCNISDEDIHKLFVGMGDAELEVLEISCTSSMTLKGLEYVGKLIAKKQIKKLIKLSDLQLNEEMLTAFHEHTSGLGQASVKELDVSYNSTMKSNAYKVLGSIVKDCGVEKLSLAGCGLEREFLEVFRMELSSKNSANETEQISRT